MEEEYLLDIDETFVKKSSSITGWDRFLLITNCVLSFISLILFSIIIYFAIFFYQKDVKSVIEQLDQINYIELYQQIEKLIDEGQDAYNALKPILDYIIDNLNQTDIPIK